MHAVFPSRSLLSLSFVPSCLVLLCLSLSFLHALILYFCLCSSSVIRLCFVSLPCRISVDWKKMLCLAYFKRTREGDGKCCRGFSDTKLTVGHQGAAGHVLRVLIHLAHPGEIRQESCFVQLNKQIISTNSLVPLFSLFFYSLSLNIFFTQQQNPRSKEFILQVYSCKYFQILPLSPGKDTKFNQKQILIHCSVIIRNFTCFG